MIRLITWSLLNIYGSNSQTRFLHIHSKKENVTHKILSASFSHYLVVNIVPIINWSALKTCQTLEAIPTAILASYPGSSPTEKRLGMRLLLFLFLSGLPPSITGSNQIPTTQLLHISTLTNRHIWAQVVSSITLVVGSELYSLGTRPSHAGLVPRL